MAIRPSRLLSTPALAALLALSACNALTGVNVVIPQGDDKDELTTAGIGFS